MKGRVKAIMCVAAIGVFSLFGASCSAAGWVEKKVDQLLCEHEITEVVAAVDATCLEEGYSEYEVCIDCGKEVVERKVEKARGHQTVVVKGKPATCTGMGLSDGAICEVCGEIVVKQENTRALGHNKVEVDAVAPTCTKTGLTAGVVCDNEGCGQVFVAQQVVPMIDHVYYKGECRTCGSVDVEEIKATDTSAMREVEVKVGDRIGGAIYRLYGVDSNKECGKLTLTGGYVVGTMSAGIPYIGSLDSDYTSTNFEALDIVYITSDYKDGCSYIDIYIPSTIDFKDGSFTFVVDSSTRLVAYSADGVATSDGHVSDSLFKLVD